MASTRRQAHQVPEPQMPEYLLERAKAKTYHTRESVADGKPCPIKHLARTRFTTGRPIVKDDSSGAEHTNEPIVNASPVKKRSYVQSAIQNLKRKGRNYHE